MGHGAWGMRHGAWGMGHGAWGMGERLNLSLSPFPFPLFPLTFPQGVAISPSPSSPLRLIQFHHLI